GVVFSAARRVPRAHLRTASEAAAPDPRRAPARCRRRRRASTHPPAPAPQNDRNAPTLKLVLLFELPLCASAFTSVISASSVRFLVSESYTPPVTLRFFDNRVGESAALARSSLLSP